MAECPIAVIRLGIIHISWIILAGAPKFPMRKNIISRRSDQYHRSDEFSITGLTTGWSQLAG